MGSGNDKLIKAERNTRPELSGSVWLRFSLLALGTLISLPWIASLIPRIPGLFDAWVFGTSQETRTSSMTFTQMILVVSVILDAFVPIVCFGVLFYQVYVFVRDRDIEALDKMAYALFIKSVSPLIPFAFALFFIPSLGTWDWSSVDLWKVLSHPEMGFWLYSPILAVLCILISFRESPSSRN
jgi:hypothetical protein